MCSFDQSIDKMMGICINRIHNAKWKWKKKKLLTHPDKRTNKWHTRWEHIYCEMKGLPRNPPYYFVSLLGQYCFFTYVSVFIGLALRFFSVSLYLRHVCVVTIQHLVNVSCLFFLLRTFPAEPQSILPSSISIRNVRYMESLQCASFASYYCYVCMWMCMCGCIVFTADIDKPNRFLLFFFFFVFVDCCCGCCYCKSGRWFRRLYRIQN